MANHIAQVLAVTLARALRHRVARLEKTEPAGAERAAGTSTSSTGDKGVPLRRVISSSKSLTTSSASSGRPFSSSQRGDSGKERRHHRIMTMGSALMTCTQRHPASTFGTMK